MNRRQNRVECRASLIHPESNNAAIFKKIQIQTTKASQSKDSSPEKRPTDGGGATSPSDVRRLQRCRTAQKTDKPSRQNLEPPEEWLLGHQSACGGHRNQTRSVYGTVAVRYRLIPSLRVASLNCGSHRTIWSFSFRCVALAVPRQDYLPQNTGTFRRWKENIGADAGRTTANSP